MYYENYAKAESETIEIQIQGIEGYHKVEWFDGIRIDPSTLPSGKHLHQTRHSDDDWGSPQTIARECDDIRVNFCGSIVTEETFDLKDETEITDIDYTD